MVIFLSPHLDDAALSCGGLLHQLVQAGHEVVVASVCTADSPTRARLSPTALRIHDTEWRLGDAPYVARRAEDVRACAMLGVKAVHLDLPDAIYRHAADGAPYYLEDFMGGRVIPADFAEQGQRLRERFHALFTRLDLRNADQPPTVFSPLALGGHIDHVITRHSAEAVCAEWGLPLRYYEDFPYAEKDDALTNTEVRGKTAHVYALSKDDLNARINAILAYTSQLEAVFHVENHPDIPAAVAERVRRYVTHVGGERYWQATPAPLPTSPHTSA
ncbi:MAG: PIG-L family deacetylase [Anaerolineae bacterium]|nr:PIG-L family deacetylase [Anaerolineae bacterium]